MSDKIDIAQDLYQQVRPLIPYFFTAIVVTILYRITHRSLIELFRELAKEWREFAEVRLTARSVNFGGIIGAFFLIIAEIWENPFSMVIPVEYRTEAHNPYSHGIACFLIVFFAAFTLLCVKVSKHSRS